jgi:predicted transcriptional regulator
LKFHVGEEENEWGDLSEHEIEILKAGIADSEAGRTHTNEYVMDRIHKKLNN